MTLKQVETALYESIECSIAFMRVASLYEQVEVYAAKANEVAYLLRKLEFINDEEVERLYNEIEYERVDSLERVRDNMDPYIPDWW